MLAILAADLAAMPATAAKFARSDRPLRVVRVATPRLQPSCKQWRIDVGGVYPQIVDRDHALPSVNAALRNAMLADERALLGKGCPTVDVPPAYFQPHLIPRYLSASSLVVSALMQAASVPPGANFSYDWEAVTIYVPTARRVRIAELFEHPKSALKAIGTAAYRRIAARSACVRRWPNPSGFAPTGTNFHFFALTPDGLALGFTAGSIAPRVCGWYSVTLPYRNLRPHLSALGRRLVAGVRRPID